MRRHNAPHPQKKYKAAGNITTPLPNPALNALQAEKDLWHRACLRLHMGMIVSGSFIVVVHRYISVIWSWWDTIKC